MLMTLRSRCRATDRSRRQDGEDGEDGEDGKEGEEGEEGVGQERELLPRAALGRFPEEEGTCWESCCCIGEYSSFIMVVEGSCEGLHA